MAATCEISRVGSLVKKTLKPERPYVDYVYTQELHWLTSLSGTPGFPILKGHEHHVFYTEYCGEMLNSRNCPVDWETQCNDILATLELKNCRHCDIKIDEILVMDGKITLIDFGWACNLDEPVPQCYFKYGVGGGCRPTKDGKIYYDDRKQMSNSLFPITKKGL